MKPQARQRGAALLVVLSLVAIASVVAMAGVKSALVDERLAGNMRAMAQAQMAADWGAAELLMAPDQVASGEREACETLEQKVVEGSWSGDWRQGGVIPDQPNIGYRWVPCSYASVPARLVVGFVDGGQHNLALHGVIVAAADDQGAGIGGLPALPEGCDTVSAGSFVNYGPNPVEMCWNSAPAPGQPAPSLDPQDKVTEVAAEFEQDEFDETGCAQHGTILFCDQSYGFSGQLELADVPEAELIVVDGAANILVSEGEYECNLVASGQIVLNASSEVALAGDIWAGGIVINGDNESSPFIVDGALVSSGTIGLNYNVMVNGTDDPSDNEHDSILWLDRSA
ncbi:hypothetical protein KUV74_18455 [Halomonas sp. DP1Y21-3]|uniref:pilus assembly PilX family protein n=1 Tax=Halomonas sp. DP1Y21-3 TaxID=2859080 RepID=UPI001C97B9F2|nr:PilX N-terminal domain-containing pilus assembly protein [Halomonas sp. DP1Y21-3]MBY6112383.1 hypothetical protein [Halomonas sp. DP1Y21-3]